MEKWFQAHSHVRLVNVAERFEAVDQRVNLPKCPCNFSVGRELAKQDRRLLAQYVVVCLILGNSACIFDGVNLVNQRLRERLIGAVVFGLVQHLERVLHHRRVQVPHFNAFCFSNILLFVLY